MSPEERQEWLVRRSKTIGASDASKIRGINPWSGPHDVWITKEPVRKALDLPDPEDDMSEVQMRGTMAEPIILDYVSAILAGKYGWSVSVPFEDVYYHPDHPIIAASWDAEIVDGEGNLIGPLEIKSMGPFAKEWPEDGPPAYIWMQVQQQLSTRPESMVSIVAGVKTDEKTWRAINDGMMSLNVAIKYGIAHFEMHEVRPDPVYNEEIAPSLVSFWKDYVETAEPPPVDHTDGCKSVLMDAVKTRSGQLSMSTEMLDLLRDRDAVSKQIAALKKDKALFDNTIREMMGSSKSMRGDGGSVSISIIEKRTMGDKRLREIAPDIFEEHAKTSRHDRITVKLK